MRYYQLIMESKVGRNLQHLEDLVFVDGSEGAFRALDILERFSGDTSDVSIKWDGTPAVIFGRDENGDFILTDISGFNAKGYDGRVKSPEALEKMLLSRGRRDVDDSRREFAANMKKIWPAFESAVPENFRGFIHGDLLYTDTPPLKNGSFVFTPNKVTYTVKQKSDIGRRIANSDVGVVVHTHTTLGGNVEKADPDMLREGKLFIMPPVIMQDKPQTDSQKIEQLREEVKKKANIIDKLIELKPGLTDIRKIIYTYVNQMSREKRWNELKTGFADWLKNSKVSEKKQEKILNSPDFKHYPVLFDLVIRIQELKNDVIEHFDKSGVDVKASIGNKPGGEGYVAARDKVKLVPRHKWTIG